MNTSFEPEPLSPRVEGILSMLPTFYVGQRIIEDGPEVVWNHVANVLEQDGRDALMSALSVVIRRTLGHYSNVTVTLEPGESPGADMMIHVSIKHPTREFIAYVGWSDTCDGICSDLTSEDETHGTEFAGTVLEDGWHPLNESSDIRDINKIALNVHAGLERLQVI